MMKLCLFLLCLLLSGCLVGPNYRPPRDCVNNAWVGEESAPVLPCEPTVAWWQLFCDPLLEKYIDLAAHYNKDIAIAESNVLQATAMRIITASKLYPQIDLDVNVLRLYFSKNGLVSAFAQGEAVSTTGRPLPIQPPRMVNLYNTLVSMTWQIDIFGKTRRAVEAAVAQIGSAMEQTNDVLITVLAEVANQYIELRSNQRRGELTEQNIALLEKNAWIVRKRLEAGYNNRLDLERIEAELSQARAALPDILAQIYQNIYALSVLTGDVPETLLCELLPIGPLPAIPDAVAIGCRSDLLRRRPDVRKAERDLAAATANIGVAVASFFPTFTFFGVGGLQSLVLRKLFRADSLTWVIGGDAHMPIFRGGNLVGNLRLSEAQQITACLTYQKTVLNALEQAEGALVAYTQELKTADQLSDAVERYERLIELTNARFTKGLVSLTDLLDSERQWNTAEQNLLSSQTSALHDLILLYQSLGGGWQPVPCIT